MDPVLECLSMKLDYEIGKLPESWIDYCMHDLIASEDFSGVTSALKKILSYLKATEIGDYQWHDDISAVQFNPATSPYFRFTGIDDIPARHVLRIKGYVDDEIRGVIALGFNEFTQINPDDGPDILTFYNNRKGNRILLSDISFYSPNKWKLILGEFFNLSGLEPEPESEVDYQ